MIAAGLGELVTGLAGLGLIVGAIVLIILAVLMPYYVYKIRHETAKTNKLLAQLLKAYGHQPED
jgi:hypothetical protein